MAKSKSKNKLIGLIIGLLALVFVALATVSVFFNAFKIKELRNEVKITEARFVVGSLKDEESLQKDLEEAIASGNEKKSEALTKNTLAYTLSQYNDTTQAASVVVVITFFGTLIFGVFAILAAILNIFGKGRILGIALSVLTAVCGLVGLICSSSIVGEFTTGVSMGCATILTFVFALVATGLQLTNMFVFKKKKRA